MWRMPALVYISMCMPYLARLRVGAVTTGLATACMFGIRVYTAYTFFISASCAVQYLAAKSNNVMLLLACASIYHISLLLLSTLRIAYSCADRSVTLVTITLFCTPTGVNVAVLFNMSCCMAYACCVSLPSDDIRHAA
ncbi:hypothetical protein NPIL_275041 [Nephila pilipes]|uniref:Uncharacterized protein n=1 Tax=Nephila pilipes TaxID=299642 RepID=A0A8X6TGN7_NEPPI|nr:hypothetical protein NPIL_275041 [Nephila pilipes]